MLGTLAALGLSRGRFHGRSLVNALVLSPLIVPVVVIAIGMFGLFVQWRLAGSLLGLVLAHTALALPFVVVAVSAIAADDGPQPRAGGREPGREPARGRFVHITFPIILPGVVTGAIFAFITSWDEVVVAIFMTSARFRTLPVEMWEQVRQVVDPTVAAVSTTLLVVTTVLLAPGARRPAPGAGPMTGRRGGRRSPSDPALVLRDLRKSFGGAVAVDGVDLEVRRGEFLTLLGPSGSGKTTTLRMIAGFMSPTGGTIEIDGQDMTRVPPYRRDVGMVFQNYALFPHMTAAQNVAFPLRCGSSRGPRSIVGSARRSTS